MRLWLIFFAFTFGLWAQKPGRLIVSKGWFQGLRVVPIVLPPLVRTFLLYQVPRMPPGYRRALEPQILDGVIYSIEHQAIEGNGVLDRREYFGIPEEIRNDPMQLVRLVTPLNELRIYGAMTSDPILSAEWVRPETGSINWVALGAMANIHIETAGAMIENNYPREQIYEQLTRARGLLELQLRQPGFGPELIEAVEQALLHLKEIQRSAGN